MFTFPRPRPLELRGENLRKKRNFFELEKTANIYFDKKHKIAKKKKNTKQNKIKSEKEK